LSPTIGRAFLIALGYDVKYTGIDFQRSQTGPVRGSHKMLSTMVEGDLWGRVFHFKRPDYEQEAR